MHSMAKAKTAKAQPKAQDPVKVDAKHYKVEVENKQVRVLRISYGPHEKSVMHGHPATVAVFLREGSARFAFPGGKSEERSWTAGQSLFIRAETHLPENLTDKPIELVLVELKAQVGERSENPFGRY